MKTLAAVLILPLLVFAGCDLAAPQGVKKRAAEAEVAAQQAKEQAETKKVQAETVKAEEPVKEPETASKPKKTKPVPKADTDDKEDAKKDKAEKDGGKKKVVSKKAEVGVGKKGHYGQAGGNKVADVLTVPIGAYFRTKEKLAFNVEIVSALKLYRAQNEGKGPPTHDDFMKDIIKANQIKLPQLRSGEEYWWDAEAEDGKGELMITQPEKE